MTKRAAGNNNDPQENTDFIYRNELDKACFQHDMAYGKSKDLTKRTQSEKVLRDKAFKIDIYKFFDKRSSGSGVAVTEPNYQFENELHRQNIGNLRKEKFIHLLETIFGALI